MSEIVQATLTQLGSYNDGILRLSGLSVLVLCLAFAGGLLPSWIKQLGIALEKMKVSAWVNALLGALMVSIILGVSICYAYLGVVSWSLAMWTSLGTFVLCIFLGLIANMGRGAQS